MISSQVNDVFYTTTATLKSLALQSVEEIKSNKIVSFSDEMKEKNLELRKFLFKNLYQQEQIYRMNKKGQLIIHDLFNAFNQDKSLLPLAYQNKISDTYTKERVICDYIAGMTDTFAFDEHKSLTA